MIIDSDAHVIETERTWELMTGPAARYRPVESFLETVRDQIGPPQ